MSNSGPFTCFSIFCIMIFSLLLITSTNFSSILKWNVGVNSLRCALHFSPVISAWSSLKAGNYPVYQEIYSPFVEPQDSCRVQVSPHETTISRASFIHSTFINSTLLRSVLILFSHLCKGIPTGVIL
jgi:hypothetical protein